MEAIVRKQSADRIHIMLLRKCRLRAQASEALRHARSERGAAVVEFALSTIVLFTFMFGLMAMCTALYSYDFIAEAAREGSRYAMVRGSSCLQYGFTSACQVTTSAQVQTYVRGLAFPGINPNNLTVTATWPTTGAACTPSVTPCNNPGNLVQVTVSYQLPVKVPRELVRSLTMTSRSQMVIAD
jgi:Flp pilus assembly protein TadG